MFWMMYASSFPSIATCARPAELMSVFTCVHVRTVLPARFHLALAGTARASRMVAS